VIEEIRVAADELRAELAGDRVTFVASTATSTSPTSAWLAALFCGFGQGRRSPDAYEVSEEDFAARVREAVEFGATEICMQGGIHPDLTLEEYGKWLRLAKQVAPQLHLHAYSPMEVDYMCERSGKGPDESSSI
jgi:FO synthase